MATTDHSHGGHGAHAASHGPTHDLPNGLNHETTDVSLTGITRMAILSFVLLFLVFGLVYGFWRFIDAQAQDTRPLPPLSDRTVGKDRLPKSGPLVLTDEPGALRQLRTHEKQVLEHYGWVDKNQGIVRLPITRAMELLAEQPARIAPSGAAPIAPAPAGGH